MNIVNEFNADVEEILSLQKRKSEIIEQRATLKEELKIIDEKMIAIKKGMRNPFLNIKGETVFQAYTAFSAFTKTPEDIDKNFERFIGSHFSSDFLNYLKPEEITTWVDNTLRRIFYTAWYSGIDARHFSILVLQEKMDEIKRTSLDWQKFLKFVDYFEMAFDVDFEVVNISKQIERGRKNRK